MQVDVLVVKILHFSFVIDVNLTELKFSYVYFKERREVPICLFQI